MSNDIEYKNRQTIPRWLPFKESNRFFIVNSFFSDPVSEEEKNNFDILKYEWLKNKSVSLAQELIASSKTLQLPCDSIISEAKSFLNINTSYNNFFLSDLKNTDIIYNCEQINIKESIHTIRNKLRGELVDPILWVDLAYYHLLLGNKDKAERCIKVALSLNSTNYYILRSASIFFIHNNDPEQALRILNTSSSSFTHPLIISSEIAIAEAFDLRSKRIKQGFEVAKNQNISPLFLTELHATLATLEYNSGSKKKGKKLLQKALLCPNENSLAQIEFINNRFDENFDIQTYLVFGKYEVNTWSAYRNLNYEKVIEQSKLWFYYHPFSTRSIVLYSYINTLIFENYTDTIDLLNRALVINPNDPVLLNNKAVALAKNNQVDEARKTINKIVVTTEHDDYDVILATKGLIELKDGNTDMGNQYYLKSVENLQKKNNLPRIARALYYWGMELLRIEDERGNRYLNEAYNLAKKSNQNELIYIIEKNRLTPAST